MRISDWSSDVCSSDLGRVGPVHAIAHDGMRFDDDLSAVLPARFADACIASVAPDGLRTELLDVLAQRCRRISLACTQARFGAVRIAYPRPSRLGVDRFLALLEIGRAHV